jgi:hypothetical protein
MKLDMLLLAHILSTLLEHEFWYCVIFNFGLFWNIIEQNFARSAPSMPEFFIE